MSTKVIQFFIKLKLKIFSEILHIILSIVLVLTPYTSADCVWYDKCYRVGIHDQNCPYEGPGFPLEESPGIPHRKAIEVLQKRCPELYEGGELILF